MIYLLGVAGQVALLLWGTHMVTSGLLRGFGHRLQPWLERHLRGRFSAFLAGLGLTTLLQSSTATGLMTASFASRGIMNLSTGLAVMLGANVGTALVAQALSFNVTAFAPVLVLIGFVGFRTSKTAIRQWGRAFIGLGLMLVALHSLMETLLPLEKNASFTTIMSALNAAPWLLLVLALFLTWMCHSSIAVVLFTASMSHTQLVHPIGLLAMVLGANLGGAIPPVLETASIIGKRIPIGNALTRLFGVLICAPFLSWIADFGVKDPRLVVDFHLLFNIVLTIIAMPFGHLLSNLVQKILPIPSEEDLGTPLHLDSDLIRDPAMRIAAATRESLRVVEMVDLMFKNQNPQSKALDKNNREKLNLAIDKLRLAIHRFLDAFDDESISVSQRIQVETLRSFTLQLGHITNVLQRQAYNFDLLKQYDIQLSDAELDDLRELNLEIQKSWQMMVALVMNPTEKEAKVLQFRKSQIRIFEDAAESRCAQRMSQETVTEKVARHNSLYLKMLRDLRQIHSHIVSCAYPILDRMGNEYALSAESEQPNKVVDM